MLPRLFGLDVKEGSWNTPLFRDKGHCVIGRFLAIMRYECEQLGISIFKYLYIQGLSQYRFFGKCNGMIFHSYHGTESVK